MNSTNNINKQRFYYFDYLKVLCIFLVVFIHRPWLNRSILSNISVIICTICVPLFFMVNGALLFNKPFHLKKHIIKIILLFISVEAWRFIYLLASLFTHQIQIENLSKSQIWYYFCGSLNIDRIATPHMWFTNTLLLLYFLFPVLKICYDYQKSVLIFFTIICFIFFQGIEELNCILSYITTFLGFSEVNLNGIRNTISPLTNYGHFLVYFIIGGFLHLYHIQSDNSKILPKHPSILLILIGFSLNLFAKYMQCNTLIWTGVSFKNGYLKIGTFLMCIGIFLLFFRYNFPYTRLNRRISYIASRTLDIYYIHMFFAALAMDYIFPLYNRGNVLINSLRAIIIIIISLLIGCLIRKIPILKFILNA